MPSANLDVVRSIYAAQERGDFSSAEWAHPNIEYVFADGPSPGSWKGVAAMTQVWREFLSAWADLHIEAEEFRELDDHRVLALTRSSGRGKASQIELEGTWTNGAALYEFQDGKVTRHIVYLDRNRALADLGLALEAGDT
jgi:ketosteroid isomerase-like protein